MVQNAEARPFAPLMGRNRKQRTDAAIAAALAGNWKAAAEENKGLLDDDSRDVEAANRLGKALTELGKTKQAVEAYRHALTVQPGNAIARKNLQRLETAKPAPKARRASAADGPRKTVTLLESSDRAAEFVLQRTDRAVLETLDAGDHVQVEADPRGAVVKTLDGRALGHIEPRAGLRLKRMIEGGNRYEVFVRTLTDDGSAVIHIRETYKHPSMVGQASFLPSPAQKRRVVRAYTKQSVVHRDRDDGFDTEDEDSEGPSADDWRPRGRAASGTDDDALQDSGFSAEDIDDDGDEDFSGDDDEADTETENEESED
ncbi:MAG: hypothetical protein GEU80_17130 [Dehalococcoidia bacterium]|nr:hypothetical protein [Dehalococcoidia bacterium]